MADKDKDTGVSIVGMGSRKLQYEENVTKKVNVSKKEVSTSLDKIINKAMLEKGRLPPSESFETTSTYSVRIRRVGRLPIHYIIDVILMAPIEEEA